MIACDQKKCRFVARDTQTGYLVCSAPNLMFTRVVSGRSFIMNCRAYERRASWLPGRPDAGIPSTSPDEGPDGLYPGQIKPQPDYTEEMENADLQAYVADQQDCDT